VTDTENLAAAEVRDCLIEDTGQLLAGNNVVECAWWGEFIVVEEVETPLLEINNAA